MYSESSNERVAELDQMAYQLLGVYPGETTEWKGLKRRLPEIMKTWKSFACIDCEWKGVCEENEEWKKY